MNRASIGPTSLAARKGMAMNFKLLGGCIAAAALVTLSAHATTKVCDYSDAGSSVATGSFSFASGDTRVLGHGDLTAFLVTVAGATHDLADANTLTDYVWRLRRTY